MNISLRIVCLAALAIYFFLIFFFLKKKRLYLKYTLLWLFSGAAMLLVVIWPSIFESLTKLIGIQAFSNGVFAIISFFILIILMSLTSIVSKLNEKNKVLTQQLAILEKRARELEEKI